MGNFVPDPYFSHSSNDVNGFVKARVVELERRGATRPDSGKQSAIIGAGGELHPRSWIAFNVPRGRQRSWGQVDQCIISGFIGDVAKSSHPRCNDLGFALQDLFYLTELLVKNC